MFVVSPQCDYEAIMLIDTWVHATLKSSHRRSRFGEQLSKLDFELCALNLSRRHPRHPGDHVTRPQKQRELVRVMKDDRVVGCQVKG